MMRMRRRHEFMCVSVTCRIIFSVNTDVYREQGCPAFDGCLPCSFADSVASPQSNMAFCELAAVLLLYP